MSIFVVDIPFKHRDHNIFEFFRVPEALLRGRVVVVAKLKNCCVPNSDINYLQYIPVPM